MILKPHKFRYPIKGHPLARGLVGCWLLNEGSGSKVFDVSENNYSGSITTPVWIPGGLSINAVHNQSANIGNISAQITNKFTIMAFVKTGTVDANLRVCANYDGIDYDFLFAIPALTANGFRLTVFTTAAVTEDDTEGGALTSNTKYVLAGVYNGANVTIYKNGKKAGGTPPAQTGNLAGRQNQYYIGSDGATTAAWTGSIYWQMFWNRALSAQEIAQLYRNPFCMFSRKQIWPSGAGAPPSGHPYYYHLLRLGAA